MHWIRIRAAAAILCGPALAISADAPAPSSVDTGQMPPETVAGRVFDGVRYPVANARVGIFRGVNPDNAPCPLSVQTQGCLEYLFSIGADRAHAITTEDGRFTLQVPGGLLETDILWAEGEYSGGERLRASWSIGAKDFLATRLDSIRLEEVFDFIAVVQADGGPISGAQVDLLGYGPGGGTRQTDATGSVVRHRSQTLSSPNARFGIYMMVRAAGFATEYWQGTIGPGTTTQVIDLERESVLTGRIVDASGRPLAHAQLKAVAVPNPDLFPIGMDPAMGTASTDAAGTFALHGLGAGRQYRVFVSTDGSSTANGERTVTAGSGPIDIAMNAAVPVTLEISGLRDIVRAAGQLDARSAAVFAALDKKLNKQWIEAGLSAQPDLVPAFEVSSGPTLAIVMEWLDPDTGAWLPVFSPREATVKDATHADLRFEKVPVGTIRIRTTGELKIVSETFGPVTIPAGRPTAIPVRVTALPEPQADD